MAHIINLKGYIPQFGENNYLAPNATVIGEVVTGKNCSIWFNAILRGDVGAIILGDDCNIQDGAILHATHNISICKLGDRVSIGHNAIIHGAKIESDVLVGMGAIIMDNTVVKSNTIIAAGSVVLANQILEANSIYAGNPAKKVKDIKDSKAASYIEYTPEAYKEYMKWYQ